MDLPKCGVSVLIGLHEGRNGMERDHQQEDEDEGHEQSSSFEEELNEGGSDEPEKDGHEFDGFGCH